MMVVAAAALVDWIYVDCRAAVTIRDISSWFFAFKTLKLCVSKNKVRADVWYHIYLWGVPFIIYIVGVFTYILRYV